MNLILTPADFAEKPDHRVLYFGKVCEEHKRLSFVVTLGLHPGEKVVDYPHGSPSLIFG
ncbi:MAG: hypothetical protein VKK80_04335 [Prochlorothrix sp.]|nr:hypothetical protein [Prochlorothrix sp.]